MMCGAECLPQGQCFDLRSPLGVPPHMQPGRSAPLPELSGAVALKRDYAYSTSGALSDYRCAARASGLRCAVGWRFHTLRNRLISNSST